MGVMLDCIRAVYISVTDVLFIVPLSTADSRHNKGCLLWHTLTCCAQEQSRRIPCKREGRGSSGLDSFGDQILVGTRFPRFIQMGPGAHSVSYVVGTGSLSEA